MKVHGNSRQNDKPHHIYVIYDKQEDDVYKYGISQDVIDEAGLSCRLCDQLDLYNRIAGWARFYAEIIYRDIAGRLKAREIEQKLIRNYNSVNNRRPFGNLMD